MYIKNETPFLYHIAHAPLLHLTPTVRRTKSFNNMFFVSFIYSFCFFRFGDLEHRNLAGIDCQAHAGDESVEKATFFWRNFQFVFVYHWIEIVGICLKLIQGILLRHVICGEIIGCCYETFTTLHVTVNIQDPYNGIYRTLQQLIKNVLLRFMYLLSAFCSSEKHDKA